ncbi:MAG: hypothetical protein LBT15_01665, partial [Synergistaceae bacterium]|nr:hypothetical protein [Synergistaceae bacterium]
MKIAKQIVVDLEALGVKPTADRPEKEAEANNRFRPVIQELAKRFGKQAPIITNAFGNKTYDGLLLGTAERNGHYYAAQSITDGHIILHDVKKDELPKISVL